MAKEKEEEIEIKTLSSKSDLVGAVPGDILGFGFYKKPVLVYDYGGITPGEIFCLSRSTTLGESSGREIWAIYEHVNDLLINEEGYFDINHFKQPRISLSESEIERLIKDEGKTYQEISAMLCGARKTTADGILHYGVNLILGESEDSSDEEYIHPELYYAFDRTLRNAGL